MKYITFKIGDKRLGISYSGDWVLEPTLINKSFTKEDGSEYINFKREEIGVVDTSKLLFDEPMKKFDGLLFITKDGHKKALKTESFFEDDLEFDVELVLEKVFSWE